MRMRRIGLLIAWILSLIAISFYGGAISYGFFFCVTLLPVISLLYLLCVYARFRIYQEIGSRNIVCREPMPYYFVLYNGEQFAFAGVSARLFSGLSYVEDMADDMEYQLLPEDRYTFRTRLVCKYRGEYEVGVKEIVITDFFRIFRLTYKMPSTIKALVYPRILQKAELQSVTEFHANFWKENPILKTDVDVTLRDYVQGDMLKHVHWKATAKEQKLKVRNRMGEEQQGITVFYDTKRYSGEQQVYLPLENQILELLLALGFFFSGKGITHTVFCGQRAVPGGVYCKRIDGINSFEMLYENMAQIVFSEQEDGKVLFRELLLRGKFAESRAVIGILHEIDNSVIATARQTSDEGMPVLLYVVTDENIEEYERQSSSRLCITKVPVDVDLEEWL